MSRSPTLHNYFDQKVLVGVGELAVSNNPSDTLTTNALGSCVGVAVYDSVTKVGGLIHIMLPDSNLSPEKAAKQPAIFADTGVPLMFRNLFGMRTERSRFKAFVAGGATVVAGSEMFKIGQRNVDAAMMILNLLNIPVVKAEVGGINNRAVHLNISNGEVTLNSPVGTSTTSLA